MIGFGLIFVGPPGAGKGTQSAIISDRWPDIAHIAPGDIFKDMRYQDTPLARRVTALIGNGQFAPNEVTLEVMREAIQARMERYSGMILDGFPRNLVQAEAFEKLRHELWPHIPMKAVYFDSRRDLLMERLIERVVCTKCHRSFHLRFCPFSPDECNCGGAYLKKRDDDRPEIIQKRFAIYDEVTAPLVGYYAERGMLLRVDASLSISQVSAQLFEIVQSLQPA